MLIYPLVKFDLRTKRLAVIEEMLKSTPIFLLIIYSGDINFSEFEPHMLRFKEAKLKILFTIGDTFVLFHRMNLIN
jgi:hypothetical protein